MTTHSRDQFLDKKDIDFFSKAVSFSGTLLKDKEMKLCDAIIQEARTYVIPHEEVEEVIEDCLNKKADEDLRNLVYQTLDVDSGFKNEMHRAIKALAIAITFAQSFKTDFSHQQFEYVAKNLGVQSKHDLVKKVQSTMLVVASEEQVIDPTLNKTILGERMNSLHKMVLTVR